MNRKQAALFIAIVTFIAVFTVVYFLDAAEQTRQKAQLHQSVLEKLTTLKVTLEKSVNAKVMLTQGLQAGRRERVELTGHVGRTRVVLGYRQVQAEFKRRHLAKMTKSPYYIHPNRLLLADSVEKLTWNESLPQFKKLRPHQMACNRFSVAR